MWSWSFSRLIQALSFRGSHFGHFTSGLFCIGSSIEASVFIPEHSCGLSMLRSKSLHCPVFSLCCLSHVKLPSMPHLLQIMMLPVRIYFWMDLTISVNFFKPPVCSNNVPTTKPSAPALIRPLAVFAALIPPPTIINPSKTALTV